MPTPTCTARPIAIRMHGHCAIYASPPTPPSHAIQHTILVMALSCRGQILALPASREIIEHRRLLISKNSTRANQQNNQRSSHNHTRVRRSHIPAPPQGGSTPCVKEVDPIYKCIYVYTHIYEYIYTHTHTHKYIYIYIYI